MNYAFSETWPELKWDLRIKTGPRAVLSQTVPNKMSVGCGKKSIRILHVHDKTVLVCMGQKRVRAVHFETRRM